MARRDFLIRNLDQGPVLTAREALRQARENSKGGSRWGIFRLVKVKVKK